MGYFFICAFCFNRFFFLSSRKRYCFVTYHSSSNSIAFPFPYSPFPFLVFRLLAALDAKPTKIKMIVIFHASCRSGMVAAKIHQPFAHLHTLQPTHTLVIVHRYRLFQKYCGFYLFLTLLCTRKEVKTFSGQKAIWCRPLILVKKASNSFESPWTSVLNIWIIFRWTFASIIIFWG